MYSPKSVKTVRGIGRKIAPFALYKDRKSQNVSGKMFKLTHARYKAVYLIPAKI